MSRSKTATASRCWLDVFQKQCSTAENSKYMALPVSALEHGPMAPLYHQLFFEGTVAEVPLKLLSNGDPDESATDSDAAESRPDTVKYWFVKVVKMAGYFFQVEYLGVQDLEEEDLKKLRKWVHKTDLRPVAHYTDLDAMPCPPPELKEHLIQDFDIVKITETLYQQILGKLTVNFMADLVFQWSLITELKPGTRVEIQHPRHMNRMVSASVCRLLGGRVEIALGDLRNIETVWYHIKSPNIRPIGWSKATGAAISESTASPGLIPRDDLGVKIVDPSKLGLVRGMCFEFINPLKLNEIVAASVVSVLNHGFFKCKIISKIDEKDLKEYAGGKNEFHLHVTSLNIFPCGTCSDNKVEIVPPEDFTGGQFEWAMYLAIIGKSPLPIPVKDGGAADGNYLDFKRGMYLEAVDSNKTRLVCAARIVSVLRGYAVRVRFMGSGKDLDQWKPIRSAEIFPAGWCKLVSYPLTLPCSAEVELPLPNESKKSVIQAKLASQKQQSDSKISPFNSNELKQSPKSKILQPNSKDLKKSATRKMSSAVNSKDLKEQTKSKSLPPSSKDLKQPVKIKISPPNSKDLKQPSKSKIPPPSKDPKETTTRKMSPGNSKDLKQQTKSKILPLSNKDLKQPAHSKISPPSSKDPKQSDKGKTSPSSNRDLKQPTNIKMPTSDNQDLKQKGKKSGSVKNDTLSGDKKVGNASKAPAKRDQASVETIRPQKASKSHLEKPDQTSSNSDISFEDEPEPPKKVHKGMPKKNSGDRIVTDLESPGSKNSSKRSDSLSKIIKVAPAVDLKDSDEQKPKRTPRNRKQTNFYGNNVEKSNL